MILGINENNSVATLVATGPDRNILFELINDK
jgi:hypothetical protein